MPRYNYRCNLCDKISTINHHSDDLPGPCPVCKKEGELTKLLTTFSTKHKTSSGLRTGQITEEFIKDSREELKQQRKKLHKER